MNKSSPSRLHRDFWARKRVVITGGAGFLGSYLVKLLRTMAPAEIRIPRSKEFDLREKLVCAKVVAGSDIVIHLAANVGGIGYNQDYPGTLFYDNLLMGVHLLEESRKAGVQKFVGIGTICEYPKFAPIPFKETDLWNGYPEEANAPYGLAKKMMIVQSSAYRAQYGFNSINLLPVNLYGPGDNFNPNSSHVIPALIKKFVEAKNTNQSSVSIWGTGKPTREFLYVEDAALGILQATEICNTSDPINLGSTHEISISDLALLIKKIVGFAGKIEYDSSKPDGQPRRKLDISRAKSVLGFESRTPFSEGLENTVNWYLSQI